MTAPFDLAETYRARAGPALCPSGVDVQVPSAGWVHRLRRRWPARRTSPAGGPVASAPTASITTHPTSRYGFRRSRSVSTSTATRARPALRSWPGWSSSGGRCRPRGKHDRRDDGSGILLYRVPSGVDPTTWPTGAGPSIEIIRHAHRYAVVWPSIHPETGQPYRWYRRGRHPRRRGRDPRSRRPGRAAGRVAGRAHRPRGNGGHVKPGSRPVAARPTNRHANGSPPPGRRTLPLRRASSPPTSTAPHGAKTATPTTPPATPSWRYSGRARPVIPASVTSCSPAGRSTPRPWPTNAAASRRRGRVRPVHPRRRSEDPRRPGRQGRPRLRLPERPRHARQPPDDPWDDHDLAAIDDPEDLPASPGTDRPRALPARRGHPATAHRRARRSDGLQLIYPGKEHAVIGEMESGKSWLLVACVAAELARAAP